MVRPIVPESDLYAALELPVDATPEAIEIAWRSLLRRHHPDVAGDGPESLARAKLINVAHDWLGDPALRRRYDESRGRAGVPGACRRAGWAARRPARAASDGDGTPGAAEPAAPVRPRAGSPADQGARLARLLERVGRLTVDDIDRLVLVTRPPIAFLATIRRFLPPAAIADLEQAERACATRVPQATWAMLSVRDAILGAVAEIVLGPFLDEQLSEGFRERARDRLLRGWEAAVDQPRYGPNRALVDVLLAQVRELDRPALDRFRRAAVGMDSGLRPWPPALDPDEDEGLRISAALAAADVAAQAPVDGLAPAQATRLRGLLGRLAHVVALRHAIPEAMLDDEFGPWRAAVGDARWGASAAGAAGPAVRRRSR